jgi:hypothetical protein
LSSRRQNPRIHEAESTTELYLEQLVRSDNPYADQLGALTGYEPIKARVIVPSLQGTVGTTLAVALSVNG